MSIFTRARGRCARAAGVGGLVVAVLASVAGCAQQVSGTGSGEPASVGPTPTGVSSTVPSPATSASNLVAAADLPGLLETAPYGSRAWDNPWGYIQTATIAQFVKEKYRASSQTELATLLRGQGVTTIVHRTWLASDAHQADMVLLRFASADGARSRFMNQTSAQQASTRSPVVRLPGLTTVEGYRFAGLTAQGNVETIFYAQVRNVDVELYYFCPAHYDATDATDWMSAQLHRLG